jgi:predicted permease
MPDWKPALRSRLSELRLAPAREAEIVEELSQHLEDRYHELLREGATAAAAHSAALDELDDHELLRREMQPLRQASVPPPMVPGQTRGHLVRDLVQDVRYAARMLGRQPGFTIAVVLTLALGIGANAALFSLINTTLFRRLPVHASHELVYVYNSAVGGGSVFSYPAYAALRDGTRTVQSLAAWGGINASLNADGQTDLVVGAIVTGNFFDVLGVTAGQGRLLGRQDDVTVGGHPVAVISDGLWRRRFGARQDIVGHEILLNGHVFTIVGVTRPEFYGAQVGSVRDLYVPMMMQAVMRPPRAGYSGEMNPDLLKNPGNNWLYAIGRLTPGHSPDQVSTELANLSTAFYRQLNPAITPRRVPVLLVDRTFDTQALPPLQQERIRRTGWLLGGVAAIVLLIACANVANLLLSRATARRRELAVRVAIGASRWRVVRQMLTESLLLSLLGGTVGVVLAWLLARSFEAAPPPAGVLPLPVGLVIDARVLAFSFLLSVLTALLFGLGPAIGASRTSLVPSLKDGTSDQGPRGRRFGFKQLLVTTEVALSLLLLVTAGLFVRSLQSTYAIDPALAADRLLSAPLNVNLLRYTRAQGRDFYQRAIERVTALPGVEAATVVRVAILSGAGRYVSLLIEGRDGPQEAFVSTGMPGITNPNSIVTNIVGTGFFDTMGIPLVSGRNFAGSDTEDTPRVVVISESAAKLHFPGIDPLSKRVKFGGPQNPWVEIVGVVRDSTYEELGQTYRAVAYLPLSQNHETGVTMYVRTSVPPETLMAAVRKEIRDLEPNLPLFEMRTMQQAIVNSLYPQRMGAWLLSAFGGLALLLAVVGVYGVLSFSIARRTREMGIRVALGAAATRVFGLVIREGMRLVCLGIAIGLGAGWFAVRLFQGLLYGVAPRDLATFGVVTALLALVALAACVIPARRAMKVDPIVALRTD